MHRPFDVCPPHAPDTRTLSCRMEQRPSQWDRVRAPLAQERAADDRRFGPGGGQGAQVRRPAHAARREDPRPGGDGGADELEVRAGERSVAVDRRHEDAPPRHVRRARRRRRSPPIRSSRPRAPGRPARRARGRALLRARTRAPGRATRRCRRSHGRRPRRAAHARRPGVRMPPEAWTGSPTAATSLTSCGRTRPDRAPSRSTRWIRRAPASAQRRASATGSSARSTTES